MSEPPDLERHVERRPERDRGEGAPSSADPVQVRLRPTLRTVAQVIGRLLLTGVSVLFIVGGGADPASFGGVLFLLLGAAGVALFGSSALVLTGNLVARRPVLEIDDEGVRRPAGWPRRASRLLRWDDLAAVGVWSQGVPAGRGHRQYLAFLPRGEADRPAAGAEILAIKMTGVPGIAEPRWSIPISEAWDRTAEEVVTAVRRHRPVPFADRR